MIKPISRELYPMPRPGSSFKLMGRETWNVWELRSSLGVVSNDLMQSCTRDFTGLEVVLSGFFSSVGLWPHHHVTPAMRIKAEGILDLLKALHLKDRYVDEMSSGEARRMLVGRALVHDPSALLLDEPTTSLDVFAQHEFREILRALADDGIGIILITHHLSDVIPEIERVVTMREGRIVADGPKEEVLTESALADLFGISVTLERRDGYYHLW